MKQNGTHNCKILVIYLKINTLHQENFLHFINIKAHKNKMLRNKMKSFLNFFYEF